MAAEDTKPQPKPRQGVRRAAAPLGALAAIPMVAAIQLIGREVVLPAAGRR